MGAMPLLLPGLLSGGELEKSSTRSWPGLVRPERDSRVERRVLGSSFAENTGLRAVDGVQRLALAGGEARGESGVS